MKPFKEWAPWQRYTTIGVAVLLVLYGVFLAVVLPSSGTTVHVTMDAGTNPDGSMYFRCDIGASDTDACSPTGSSGNLDQAKITVHKRDKLQLTVRSLDGGGRAHDVKMEGIAYFLPPARMEMELQHPVQTKTVTMWMAGTFHVRCELPGHEGRGMWATVVVA
jgi:hypothetical protein